MQYYSDHVCQSRCVDGCCWHFCGVARFPHYWLVLILIISRVSRAKLELHPLSLLNYPLTHYPTLPTFKFLLAPFSLPRSQPQGISLLLPLCLTYHRTYLMIRCLCLTLHLLSDVSEPHDCRCDTCAILPILDRAMCDKVKPALEIELHKQPKMPLGDCGSSSSRVSLEMVFDYCIHATHTPPPFRF